MYALVKSAPAPTPRPGFASAVELAVVSRVGKPKWHGSGYVPNRWVGLTPNRAGTDMGHPTEKPSEPLLALVGALCSADGMVLDPFAGSGTTLRAAKDLNRKAIGVELEERYCEVIAKRLAQDVLDVGVVAAVVGTALAVDGAYRWAAFEAVTVAACAVMAVQCRRYADEEAA